jgi:hypothetical protein
MLTKTMMALATTLLLGTASAALAKNDDTNMGGYPVQTWQDIQHDQQDFRARSRASTTAAVPGMPMVTSHRPTGHRMGDDR